MRRIHPAALTLLAALVLAPSFARAAEGAHAYVGSRKCKVCHIREHKSWEGTKMARSFELLKPGVAASAKTKAKLDPKKDYTGDKTCLPCHTTGYGKPGGFVDLATTPDLAGVGCETCHGAGGTYLQKEHMSLTNKEYKKAALVAAGLVAAVSRELCDDCHNSKSPFFKDFDFEERKTKGTHEKFPLKYQH